MGIKRATLVVALIAFLGAMRTAESIPAFARKYNTKCIQCHDPLPPRLNNIGITFKRMGYRLPDADDEGNLIFKEGIVGSPTDVMSLTPKWTFTNRSTQLRGWKREEQGEEGGHGGGGLEPGVAHKGKITAELFSAAPIGRFFSYSTMFEAENRMGVEMEMGDFQINLGKETMLGHLRIGQMKPLLWQKADHQVVSLRTPLAFSRSVPIGEFGGLNLAEPQRGLELGFTYNHLGDEGKLYSTMFSLMALNGLRGEGEGRHVNHDLHFGGTRDWLFQVMQTLGTDSTVSLFYYTGRTPFTAVEVHGDGDVVRSELKNHHTRLGLMGNHRVHERVDLLWGVVWGDDRLKGTEFEEDESMRVSQRSRSRGFFTEVDVLLTKPALEEATEGRTVGYARFDYFDRKLRGGPFEAYTVGLRRHFLTRWNAALLGNLELQYLHGEGSQDKRIVFGIELSY